MGPLISGKSRLVKHFNLASCMCYLPFFTKDFTVLLLMIGVILSQDLDHRAETILQLAQRAQRARCEPKVPQF